MRLYYATFKSPVGEILATRTEKGLNFITFPKSRWQRFLEALRRDDNIELKKDEKRFSSLKKDMKRYFSGKRVSFRQPLDLSGGTPFQKRVWKAMQRIPPGQTKSYGWLARQAGGKNMARAAGAACGANPIPIVVPCHRVVKSDGSLGGYGGGLGVKRKLLSIERAAI
ncbi:MAG: methylated-DNA--[protein]-cysteine S-methyltransferase [Candidatus Zixiibacteriota bacterium]|nr:MAG: methylated-DNA--[protein]-cysteine S-methyltransferase [candidate division Zixibacteria bacterium]